MEHAASSLHNLFITFNQLDLKKLHKKSNYLIVFISPILNYTSCIRTKFAEKYYMFKKYKLNAIYGELGRVPMFIQRK